MVGLVGSGGSMGAAVFSTFFAAYNYYRPAFLLMGVAAACSSILSCFMNTRRIAQMQEALNIEVSERKDYDEIVLTPATTEQGPDEKL